MAESPRILQVTTAAMTLRAFLVPYARHFRSLGWKVDAATGVGQDALDGLEDYGHIHNIAFRRSPWRTNVRSVIHEIRRIAANERYDLVHVHTPVAAFLTRAALRHRSVPVVYTAHGFHFFPGGTRLGNMSYQVLERLAQPWTTRLIVMNAHDYRKAVTHLGYRAEHVRHWPGIGVDVARLSEIGMRRQEIRGPVRASLGLSDADFVFIYPAEFNAGKRHLDLLQAFAGLSDTRAVLLFAGAGPMTAQVTGAARELQIANRVRFLGQRTDVPQLLCASDCMVFPTEREGLSRSVLEAMALGCPIIGSSARGVADLLDPDRGWIFPVGDTGALRTLMEKALRQPSGLADIATKARLDVAQYDTAPLLELHETLYREVLGEQHA